MTNITLTFWQFLVFLTSVLMNWFMIAPHSELDNCSYSIDLMLCGVFGYIHAQTVHVYVLPILTLT